VDTALRDSAVLSSVDNHFVVDTSKSKRIDPKDMPVSEYLMVTEDYSGERVLYSRGLARQEPLQTCVLPEICAYGSKDICMQE